MLCATLVNSYWPLQLLIYKYVRGHAKGPVRDAPPWKAYLFVGSAGAVTSLMRAFGINYLSGVLYVVCSNTEVIFATVGRSCVETVEAYLTTHLSVSHCFAAPLQVLPEEAYQCLPSHLGSHDRWGCLFGRVGPRHG